ncbi:MAG: prolyl oligopeptidase family serine peptidase [Dehalococcoidia bacterium]
MKRSHLSWLRAPAVQLTSLIILVAASLLTACGEGEEEAVATVAAPESPVAATATPQRLAVTPVEQSFVLADPSFEALPGAQALFGEYEGGGYRFEVPDDWNGDLVMWAHGFRGFGRTLTVDMPPLRQHFIDEGFAWAASSYRENGYVPGIGAEDTLALIEVFEREVGQPERTYLFGASMGGHVTVLSLEQRPQAYDGALALCGVVSGVDILDFLVNYMLVAAYVTEVDLAEALADPEAFADAVEEQIIPALGGPGNYTEKGRQFASVIKHLSGGPRPWWQEGFDDRFEPNFELLISAVAAPGGGNLAASNLDTVYHIDPGLGLTDEELNESIPRIAFDPEAREESYFNEFMPMSGEIEAPLLALHNTGDLWVTFSLEQSYRRTVEEASNGDLLVQRAIRRPGHCNFSEAEILRAFDDLVRWVEEGLRPAGDDVLAADLTDVGLEFTDPLEPGDPGGM